MGKNLWLYRIGFGLALTLCMMLSAQADPLVITPSSTPRWTTDDNSNLSLTEIQNLTGCGCLLTEAYKSEVDGGDEFGDFADNYDTTYTPPDDPEDAYITWTGGDFITGTPIFLLVKDGNQSPAQYIFDITGWNGMDDLDIQGFWADTRGGISHVSILTGPLQQVPEPASLMLIGAGLVGLAALRKKNGA